MAPQAQPAAEAQPARPQPAPPTACPAARAAPPNPYDDVRQRPPSLQVGLPTARPAAAVPAPIAPVPAGIPHDRSRARRARWSFAAATPRAAFAERSRGCSAAASVARACPGPPRRDRSIPWPRRELAADLGTRGASQTWTSQLISTAGAHGSPLAGSLRAAAEAEVARRIVRAPALPVTGAAVAFIGAGGAGKTRCTAALASAYSRASTLGVTVIALDNPDGARELKRLLSGDGVPVLSLSGERAKRAIDDRAPGRLRDRRHPHGHTHRSSAGRRAGGASSRHSNWTPPTWRCPRRSGRRRPGARWRASAGCSPSAVDDHARRRDRPARCGRRNSHCAPYSARVFARRCRSSECTHRGRRIGTRTAAIRLMTSLDDKPRQRQARQPAAASSPATASACR